MGSSIRLVGLHFSVAFALWAAACQPESTALFDDTELAESGRPSAEGGSKSAAEGGEPSAAGDGAAGFREGASGSAGVSSGGAGVAGTGGSTAAGEAGNGGKPGGSGGAGSAGKGGAGGSGGASGSGGATQPGPDPVTVDIRDIDDASVASCRPLENFGTEPSLTVDASGSGIGKCTYQALFAFSLGVVPSGSKIEAATLTLHCANAGDAVGVSYVDEAWQEGTVRWSQRPAQGEKLSTFECAASGPIQVDLGSAVAAWISGKRAAHGIYLATDGTNGTDFATSEAKNEANRPVLRVTYAP